MQARPALVFGVISVLAAIVVACGGDSAKVLSNDPQDLRPGTTLHTVEVSYRRHGPAADIYAQHFPDYGPETLYGETWMEFGDDGTLVTFRGESRLEDGTLYSIVGSEGDDVVSEDADGVEQSRHPGTLAGVSVDTYKTAMNDALSQVLAELEEQPDAPVITLRGTEVRVLEQRRPFTRTAMEASPTSYQVPYLFDLKPAEQITREYISPDEARGFRYEVAVVDAAGTETVIEYTDHLVVEILER